MPSKDHNLRRKWVNRNVKPGHRICGRCYRELSEDNFGVNSRTGKPMNTCSRCRVTKQVDDKYRRRPKPIDGADIARAFLRLPLSVNYDWPEEK